MLKISRVAAFAVLGLGPPWLAGCAERIVGANWSGSRETASGQEFTPVKATRRGVAGWALLGCQVGREQSVRDCVVLGESPQGWEFGASALRMQSGLKAREGKTGAPYMPEEGVMIKVPVVFCPREPSDACQAKMMGEAFALGAQLEAQAKPPESVEASVKQDSH